MCVCAGAWDVSVWLPAAALSLLLSGLADARQRDPISRLLLLSSAQAAIQVYGPILLHTHTHTQTNNAH